MKSLPSLALLFALAAASPAHPASAQTGDCVPGTAEADLETTFVRARLYNGGNLFFGGGSESQYVVPKREGVSPMYATFIWLGGMVGGELRTAAATYANREFWPGPLDAAGRPPADCVPYDRIYAVSRADLEAFSRGEITDAVRAWPAHLGAPVADGDGVEGNYDAGGGDRPALFGDQMRWWVMNDAGNVHESSRTAPLRMEVQATAFGFDYPNVAIYTSQVLPYTTFYRYRLVYRGDEPLTGAYFGIFADPDLGNASDDYVGSDTTLDLGFVYNADDHDDQGYGAAPPAAGFALLRGPVAGGDTLGMAAFMFLVSGGPIGTEDPGVGAEYYNTLRGRWRGGESMTESGLGFQTPGRETTFMYSGDPTTGQFWSEFETCGDGVGCANPPGDRRMLLSTGPFAMNPGDEQTIHFALVYARGDDHLASVRRLKNATAVLHALAGSIYAPTPLPQAPPPEVPTARRCVRSRPVPVRDRGVFEYALPGAAEVRLSLFDALGREVRVLVDARQEAGTHTAGFDASGLAAGVYYARFVVTGLDGAAPVLFTDPVVVAR